MSGSNAVERVETVNQAQSPKKRMKTDPPTKNQGKMRGSCLFGCGESNPEKLTAISYKSYGVQQCAAHDVRVHFWGRKVDHADQKKQYIED
jgi:hypothetical protein